MKFLIETKIQLFKLIILIAFSSIIFSQEDIDPDIIANLTPEQIELLNEQRLGLSQNDDQIDLKELPEPLIELEGVEEDEEQGEPPPGQRHLLALLEPEDEEEVGRVRERERRPFGVWGCVAGAGLSD